MVGDSLRKELAAIGNGFVGQDVAALTVLTRSEDSARELQHAIDATDSVAFDVRCVGDDIEG
ncbi:MAG: hypothetical protein L7S53_02575, partial [Luminiphilus sp.]|nr:hypothetical protein [Luminiphilus sp.]